MRVSLAIAAAWLLAAGPCFAQGTVLQGGPTSAGHTLMYTKSGTSQPTVKDAGGANGGPTGVGLSEIGIVARGTGTAPYAGQGTGPFGTIGCFYDAPTNNPTGYHYFCMSPNTQGGGLLAYGAGGTAAQLPFKFKVNGSDYEFPFVIGGIVGPVPSTVDGLACWSNASGTLLKNCTVLPTFGPGTTIANDLACWDNGSGTLLKDCTALPATTTATTTAATDSSTKVATTAFVQGQAACTSAASVGFIADGVTNNDASWNSWIASIGTSSGCLEFSAGRYRFTTQISASLAAGQTLVIRGAGQDATEWHFPNATNGFSISMAVSNPGYVSGPGFTLENGAVLTATAGGTAGVTIDGNEVIGYIPKQTNIRYVTFRGDSSTHFWGVGLQAIDLSNLLVDHIGVYGADLDNVNGIGIEYFGTAAGTTPTIVNISNLTSFFLGTAVYAHGEWEGLNITQSNIVDVGYGVHCTSGSHKNQCNVSNSHISAVHNGILLTSMQESTISGNLLFMGAYVGGVSGDAAIESTLGRTLNFVNNTISVFDGIAGCISMGSESNNTVTGNYMSGCPVGLASFAVTGLSHSSNTYLSNATAQTSGLLPALSSCGTSPSILTGSTNYSGLVVAGSGLPTGCTVTFASGGFSSPASCVVSRSAGFTPGLAASNDSLSLVVAFSAATDFVQFRYVCKEL